MEADHCGHAFVGDVQGCADEFDELLGHLADTLGEDYRLHCVGDLVNRGPDNLRVLERVRGLLESGRAEYVLGNHEIGLIRTYMELRSLSERDTVGDVLESSEAADWVNWLRQRPIIEANQIAGERYVMVHASVHPDWSFEQCRLRGEMVSAHLAGPDLEKCREFLALSAADNGERDDLGRLVSCRSVASGQEWSSGYPEPGNSRPWHAAWRERGHDYGVVYGHWAIQGLHVAPGLRGLDTGCVHHRQGSEGRLTAWLPTQSMSDRKASLFGLPDDRFLQVVAHKAHGRRA